jgi:hypothetical protein
MVNMDSNIDTELTYEAVPARLPERELAALLTALAQREPLAVIE